VVATLCLFLLLGGTAVAVDGSLPGQNTVGSADIINGEVKNTDLGPDSVSSGRITDGQVKNTDLGPNAVSSNSIADGGVKGIDIGSGQVTGADVGNDSLTANDIADIISSGGVTQVAVGEEKTLLQDGPFTVTAICLANDSTNPETRFSQVWITSSEAHSVYDFGNFGGGEIPPGGSARQTVSSDPAWDGSHLFAAAPSGATLQGYAGAGVHTLGYDDCTAVVSAIGTSALH
jgi:hypothetical protein